MYFKFLWLIKIYRYYKGRLWCLTFHSPVVRCLGGYGGIDHFGRRRKSYHNMWCVKCGNHWDQKDHGEPCVGSHIWHFRKNEKKKNIEIQKSKLKEMEGTK